MNNELNKEMINQIILMKKEIDELKRLARLTTSDDFRKGYLKALNQVITLYNEFIGKYLDNTK